jgi:hypothetical protein
MVQSALGGGSSSPRLPGGNQPRFGSHADDQPVVSNFDFPRSSEAYPSRLRDISDWQSGRMRNFRFLTRAEYVAPLGAQRTDVDAFAHTKGLGALGLGRAPRLTRRPEEKSGTRHR